MGPFLSMDTMFLTRSEFSGCFSSTSRNPGSDPVSNTPNPGSCSNMPSCQNTWISSDGGRAGDDEGDGWAMASDGRIDGSSSTGCLSVYSLRLHSSFLLSKSGSCYCCRGHGIYSNGYPLSLWVHGVPGPFGINSVWFL